MRGIRRWPVNFPHKGPVTRKMFSLPPPWRRLCFHRCPLPVCLSVSLLATLRKNDWTDFQGRWDLIQGTIEIIFRMFHLTPWTQDFFPTFSEQSMPLSSIAEKRLNRFSWNLQQRTDMTHGAIWNIFAMLRLTPWILGRFIYFLDPCFVCNIMEKWANGFLLNFHETLGMTQEIIRWTVSYLPRLFHGLPSRCPGRVFSNTTVKSMSGFPWNFQDILAMTQ